MTRTKRKLYAKLVSFIVSDENLFENRLVIHDLFEEQVRDENLFEEQVSR